MKIRIIQIGKNKDRYIVEGLEEFLKRLKPFARIEIITLKEVVAGKTFTKDRCKEKEGEEILKAIESGRGGHSWQSRGGKCGQWVGGGGASAIIALDERGKEFTSVEFSKLLGKFMDSGQTIIFIIGGPYGLADKVKQRADSLFAISRMTFTHQMIRLFLLEQIYRGVSILKGKEYHNE